MPDLVSIVRPCPLASTVVAGDCHSLGHSVARGPVPRASGPPVTYGFSVALQDCGMDSEYLDGYGSSGRSSGDRSDEA
jgi:hypothetical protein